MDDIWLCFYIHTLCYNVYETYLGAVSGRDNARTWVKTWDSYNERDRFTETENSMKYASEVNEEVFGYRVVKLQVDDLETMVAKRKLIIY